MADKQKENKFMAMLERRDIIRKVAPEGEPAETEPANARTHPETDLRSLFGTTGDPPKVTPAARQPVPGFTNPIMPGELRTQTGPEQPKPASDRTMSDLFKPTAGIDPDKPVASSPVFGQIPDTRKAENTGPEQPKPIPAGTPEKTEPFMDKMPRGNSSPFTEKIPLENESPFFERAPREQPGIISERIPGEQPKPAESSKSSLFFTRSDPFKTEPSKSGQTIQQPLPLTPQPAPFESKSHQQPPEPPPPDNTERYLNIEELYEALAMKSRRTDTIYLIEEYLRSLPDSLPDDSRREIVRKLIAASGFDYDLLMGDGVLRVKMLKEYAEKFARHTDEYVAARNGELADLERQIIKVQKLIENRRDLHKKQFFAIEAEAQRLKEILTFITGQ